MKLTFYGGAGEIGGNKILLEDRDARLFLDMGVPFTFGDRFFADWLSARGRFGLKDYFALDLMPRIQGLYSAEALECTDFPHKPPAFGGILITHIHWDHTNHLQWVDPEIPVHMGEGTKRILDSWATTSGSADLGEHEYRPFRTGKELELDGVTAEPIHVDHSAPAAYGYLLHTSEGTVAYTGDLRRHGPRAEFTEEFLERAAKEKPIALIIEGTRVAPEDTRQNFSEAEVLRRAVRLCNDAEGKMAIATFYPRDVDRIRTFWQTAKSTGRTFVLSAKAGHLLRALAQDKHIDVPKVMEDEDVRVYFRDMDRPGKWESELRDSLKDRAVDAAWVHKHQRSVLMQLDFEHFGELIDIRPEKGTRFIHSKSEPFEEDDPNDEVMHHWLEYFGLVYHQLHASGHLSREEVAAAIAQVNPKVVIPVHTEHPELFKEFHPHVKLPKNFSSLDL